MVQPSHDSFDDSSETMRYGMLGHDGASPVEKMEKYLGEVSWTYLKPHFEAGALLYVDPSLELAEVGRALVEDEVEKVNAWRKEGDILSPSQPHADYWEESEARFLAAVVMPFVLIQPLAGEEAEA